MKSYFLSLRGKVHVLPLGEILYHTQRSWHYLRKKCVCRLILINIKWCFCLIIIVNLAYILRPGSVESYIRDIEQKLAQIYAIFSLDSIPNLPKRPYFSRWALLVADLQHCLVLRRSLWECQAEGLICWSIWTLTTIPDYGHNIRPDLILQVQIPRWLIHGSCIVAS